MIDRIEQPDDVALDLQSVRHCQLTVEQSTNSLGDDRLAVAGRSVHEHRMGRADGGANLIEDALAQH